MKNIFYILLHYSNFAFLQNLNSYLLSKKNPKSKIKPIGERALGETALRITAVEQCLTENNYNLENVQCQ